MPVQISPTVTDAPVMGWTSQTAPNSFLSTRSMNRSSTMTERLKLATSPSSRFMAMNARISGCQTFRIPMFAPRRRPPCLITSVAALKTRMNEIGPEATPSVDCTGEPSGRMCEKLYPVPPPVLWMIAPYFMLSKIPSIESGTGRVKQAESWPISVPAFISVGEFGRNRRLLIAS